MRRSRDETRTVTALWDLRLHGPDKSKIKYTVQHRPSNNRVEYWSNLIADVHLSLTDYLIDYQDACKAPSLSGLHIQARYSLYKADSEVIYYY